ncbi:MAG: formylmethanofuran dehydrogenase subunit E family protein [Armatimonadetes bacterium]|nr:formylmethanofuran dehydrogenase subunit E family protein [Armatimonadota bacterium]
MPVDAATFRHFIKEAIDFHGDLCRGQMIGVRMSLAALKALGIHSRRGMWGLVAFAECEGCLVDALQVVTNCRVGRGTLKVIPGGGRQVTFVDSQTGKGVRIAVRPDCCEEVNRYGRLKGWNAEDDEGQLRIFSEIEDSAFLDLDLLADGEVENLLSRHPRQQSPGCALRQDWLVPGTPPAPCRPEGGDRPLELI